MTSFNDYLVAMQGRNPWLRAEDKSEVKMKAKDIRTLLEDAFNKGYTAGKNSKSLFEEIMGYKP
jgi:hypothetical protein